MSSTEVEKYSSGYVFSQQSELESLNDPENYLEEVKDARRIQQQSIEYNQRVASEPLSSNSREAWARRNQAKKAVKEAKKATKQINKMEKEVKEQVTARRTYLEAQKSQERQVYVEAAKKKEQEMKFLVEKEKWISSHKIRDIPKGIELGYLSEGSMSWYRRLKALEAPYANSRRDLPNRERNKLEFLYKGGIQKEWDAIIKHQDTQRAASQRQSASIKGAAAIVESGGTLGGKFSGVNADGSLAGSDLRATSTDPKIAAANQAQSAYVAQLRAGGIGLAQALLKPQTEQSYIVKGQQATKDQTSINLETFLTERGYDISKPELIPDSIFKAPVKYTSARAQTKEPTMGDLTTKIPDSPQITKAELDQRKAIQQKFAIPESPPEIVITKTETKTTPSTLQPVSAQVLAQQDSKLPPGFQSGEAVPLINYDKGLAGGFFGYTAELYTSVSNMFKPEGQQKYVQPSLESAFVDETISGAKHLVGWRDEEGNLPPLKTGQTQDLILNKDVGWLVGTVGATVALGAATFGAQKVYPFIKGLYSSLRYDKQVVSLASQLSSKSNTYQVEKLPGGKYLLTAGTEANPAQVPAIIVQPGRKGSSQLYSEYLPSQLPPTSLTISGGTKGLGLEKMQEIAPYLTHIPGTKFNIQQLSNPNIYEFMKPVGQTTKFSWQEIKKFPKTVLAAATSSDTQMSRGIIAETKAVKIKPTETKPFKTTVLSSSGKNVDRIFSPKTGKFKFPSGKNVSTLKNTTPTKPDTKKIKDVAKELAKTEDTQGGMPIQVTGSIAGVSLSPKVSSDSPGLSVLEDDGNVKQDGGGFASQDIDDSMKRDASLSFKPQTTTFTTTSTATIPLSTPLKMSTPTIQKDKASISLKDVAIELTSAKEKQGMKSATIPITKTIARQQLSTPQVTKTNLRLVPGLKWRVQTKTKLALVPALKQTTITPPTPTRHRTPIVPIPPYNPLIRQEKEKKKVTKKKRGFKGNVPETTIVGIWKEDKEITYGKKKIKKLVSRDWKLIKGGKGSLINVKTPKKPKRKRKSSTENVL